MQCVRVPFSMAKRKIGGYEISDPDDSHSESESVPAKKAKSYAPPMLTKAVFKLPLQSPSSSRSSELSSEDVLKEAASGELLISRRADRTLGDLQGRRRGPLEGPAIGAWGKPTARLRCS